jgi:hypothetical protein
MSTIATLASGISIDKPFTILRITRRAGRLTLHCLDRRRARDIRERGPIVESVTERYRETARLMCDADLVLTGMNLLEPVGAMHPSRRDRDCGS